MAASPTPTSAAQTMDASAEPSAAASPAAALCSEIRSTRKVSGPGVMESSRHSPAKANRVTAVMGSILRAAAAWLQLHVVVKRAAFALLDTKSSVYPVG